MLRISFLLSLLCLSGCTWLHSNAATDAQCAAAPVLYTDLTQTTDDRITQLPSGQDCSEYAKHGADNA